MTVRCNVMFEVGAVMFEVGAVMFEVGAVMFEVGAVMGSYYMGTMRVVGQEFQRDLEIKEASE